MDAQVVDWIVRYGYAGTFLGMLLEGETFLLAAGVSAQQGYLDARVLALIGACGAMLTDNFFFGLGRLIGPAVFVRFPRLGRHAGRVHAFAARYPRLGVFAMRFLYGTRSVGPTLLGSGPMSWLQFVALDAVAAATWSATWIVFGLVLGEIAERWLARSALPLIVAAAAVIVVVLALRRRK